MFFGAWLKLDYPTGELPLICTFIVELCLVEAYLVSTGSAMTLLTEHLTLGAWTAFDVEVNIEL